MPGRSVLEVRCRVLTAVLRPAAACALLAAAASTARGQCQYEVTIIQASECPPFGFPPTFGVGLNDDGKVVGYYASGVVGPDRPFIWTTDGGFQSMPPPPGAYEARFNDINNAGQICGTMTIADVGFRGFFYENGQYTELPPLPGGAWSGASALNDAGQVVSFRSIGPGVNPYNAFLWSEAEGFIDLGVMSWGISTARDLNDAGMVTGFTGGSPWSDGFVWQNGELLMLGPIPGGTDSSALGINSHGIVTGVGMLKDPTSGELHGRPFVWDGDEMLVLGILPGFTHSGGRQINDACQVVGFCSTESTPIQYCAFLSQDGSMLDLNDLAIGLGTGIVERPFDINEGGQIVADGEDSLGHVVTFLLTPVARPPGDLNIDCQVDYVDLQMLLDDWGQANSPADLNGDGGVDVLDLLLLLALWT